MSMRNFFYMRQCQNENTFLIQVLPEGGLKGVKYKFANLAFLHEIYIKIDHS